MPLVSAKQAVIFSRGINAKPDAWSPGSSVFLALFPACACKPPAPKNGRRGAGPRAVEAAPAAADRPQPGLQRRLRAGRARAALERRAVEAGGGRTFVDKGELCMEVKNRGANRWDAQLRHQHIKLQKGHTYTVQFKMRVDAEDARLPQARAGRAAVPRVLEAAVRHRRDSRRSIRARSRCMAARRSRHRDGVPHGRSAGAADAGRRSRSAWTTCASTIPQYAEKPEPVPPPIPNVLVNQVGYFPALAKIATVKNPNAVPWELRQREGRGRSRRGRRFRSAPTRRRATRSRSPTSRRTPRRGPATR